VWSHSHSSTSCDAHAMLIMMFFAFQLPKIDDMFDSSKLLRQVIKRKCKVLWRALHSKTLDLSEISSSEGGSGEKGQVRGIPPRERGFSQVTSADTVAHAPGHRTDKLVDDFAPQYLGLDYLGVAWQYTQRMGTFLRMNF